MALPEAEPINTRLKLKRRVQLKPRSYQRELYGQIKDNNSIVCLGTGLGKTFVVVLYLNDPYVDRLVQRGQRIVFLAPTQDLTMQQAEYINHQVPYRVKVYCGRTSHCGEHIDKWDKSIWSRELDNYDLLFMTPQIFLSAISTNLLDWDRFAAIIFDECHHASTNTKGHESNYHYVKIMNCYKNYFGLKLRDATSKPRIIGLTASLINSFPKDVSSIRKNVEYLERKFDNSRCITHFEVQETLPKFIVHSFNTIQCKSSNDDLMFIFDIMHQRMNEALKAQKAEQLMNQKDASKYTAEEKRIVAYATKLKLAVSGFSIKPGSFPKLIQGLMLVRSRCGLWALRAVCRQLVSALERHSVNSCLVQELKPVYIEFTQMLSILVKYLDKVLVGTAESQSISFSMPKSRALLDILKDEYERKISDTEYQHVKFSSVVFVSSRLEVKALYEWLKFVSENVKNYMFIKPNYAIGLAATMTSKYACITKRSALEQHKMLDDFRKGQLNVILTTSVLEEGIDLPVCSTVVRYDIPKDFRGFVQSRGRSRQAKSTFVSMCEDIDRDKTKKNLDAYRDFEVNLKKFLQERDLAQEVKKMEKPRENLVENRSFDEEDYFKSEDGKIMVDSGTARILLMMYCQRLSKNHPFSNDLECTREVTPCNRFKTTVHLPSGCPLRDPIAGNIKSSQELADCSAIIATVRALNQAKELDEHLVPIKFSERKVMEVLAEMNLAPKKFEIPRECRGTIVTEKNIQVCYFEPRVIDPGSSLTHNANQRCYKLIKVIFEIDRAKFREDVSDFFRKPTFGLIVDPECEIDILPDCLQSHYGQLKVRYEVIDTRLHLSYGDHAMFVKFLRIVLSKWFSIGGLYDEVLRDRCQSYMVLIREDNSIARDLMRAASSFQRKDIRQGDVVSINWHYSKIQRPQQPRHDNYEQDPSLMLVRKVHNDMNALSLIPGTRMTFVEHAEKKYGAGSVRREHYNQPIIEVMPISKQLAQIKPVKMDVETKTRSLHYLEQFLTVSSDDPSRVFQALNFGEILFRVQQAAAVLHVHREYIRETTGDRREQFIRPDPPRIVVADEIGDMGAAGDALEINENEENFENQNDAEDEIEEEDYDSQDESDSLDLGSLTDDSSDSLSAEEHDVLTNDDVDARIRTHFDLKSDDDGDGRLKAWNTELYENPDMVRHDYFEKGSIHSTAITSFAGLSSEILSILDSVVDRLKKLEFRILDDKSLNLDESGLTTRQLKVNRNIKPNLKLDRDAQPLKNGSHIKSLLEALTHKRAQEAYSLEALEIMGDSYLKYVVSMVLFKYVDAHEGLLTAARSSLVCNSYFENLIVKRGLGPYAIQESFSKDVLATLMGQRRPNHMRSKNRLRPKDFADMFESIVGAKLLYHGQFEAIMAMKWLGLDIFNKSCFDEFHEQAVTFHHDASPLFELRPDERARYELHKLKFAKFEDIIGYQFSDKSYLMQAFTHTSSRDLFTNSYERLEFLGDSILDFLVSITLNSRNIVEPGQLTLSRSALVSNYAYAKLAVKYRFDLFIQHCNQDIQNALFKLRLALHDKPTLSSMEMVDFDQIVKLLGDVFESVAGAIYLDSGCSLDTVWSVYYPILADAIESEIENPTKNERQELYETFPGKDRITFTSHDESTELGTLIKVKCIIKDFRSFEGLGDTARIAKIRAIHAALSDPETKSRCEELNRKFNQDHPPPAPTRKHYSVRRPQRQQPDRRNRQFNNNNRSRSHSRSDRGRW